MKITKKSFYAIQALLYLNNNPGRTISSVEICEKQNISKSFLQIIFHKLTKGGVIESAKGAGGGYELKIKATELTIWKILHSIGEIKCTKKPSKENNAVEFDIVDKYLDEFDSVIETQLLSFSLYDVSIGNFDVSNIEKEPIEPLPSEGTIPELI